MGKLVMKKSFCLGVEEYEGIIHAEQGMTYFYCEQAGIIASLPCFVSPDMYEQRVRVYMHNGTREILLELGEDDKMLEDLDNNDVDLLAELDIVESYAEKVKMKKVDNVVQVFGKMMWLAAVSVILVLLKAYHVAILGGVYLLVHLLMFIRSLITLDSHIVYDINDNWVNIETGVSSLNGGYNIDLWKEDNL